MKKYYIGIISADKLTTGLHNSIIDELTLANHLYYRIISIKPIEGMMVEDEILQKRYCLECARQVELRVLRDDANTNFCPAHYDHSPEAIFIRKAKYAIKTKGVIPEKITLEYLDNPERYSEIKDLVNIAKKHKKDSE
jgi:hypothetical protein